MEKECTFSRSSSKINIFYFTRSKIMQHKLHNTGENASQVHVHGYFQATTEYHALLLTIYAESANTITLS
jgi:hypothetical protein